MRWVIRSVVVNGQEFHFVTQDDSIAEAVETWAKPHAFKIHLACQGIAIKQLAALAARLRAGTVRDRHNRWESFAALDPAHWDIVDVAVFRQPALPLADGAIEVEICQVLLINPEDGGTTLLTENFEPIPQFRSFCGDCRGYLVESEWRASPEAAGQDAKSHSAGHHIVIHQR